MNDNHRFWPHNILLSILMCLFFIFYAASVSAREPIATSTFIQILPDQKRNADYWSQLFASFRDLGLSKVIVQWTVYNNTAFYPSENYQQTVDTLSTILTLADDSNIEVLVGLNHDPEYWNMIDRSRSTFAIEVYMLRLLAKSIKTSNEMLSLVSKHSSFQGWYINQEIDDINWREPAKRKALFSYLGSLSSHLNKIAPSVKVAISGFSNARLNPRAFEHFWSELLSTATIDIVLFQDGVGTRKLKIDEGPIYMKAIKKSVNAHARELYIVVEIFKQIHGPGIDDKPFKAVPASLERIIRQQKVALEFSSIYALFSTPEYMSPLGDKSANDLFKEYLQNQRVFGDR